MLELDKNNSLLAFSSKLCSAVTALALIIYVGIYFSVEQQGYYYAFISIAAFRILGELGLSIVMSPVLSHEWAHLYFDDRSLIKGPEFHIKRFKEIIRFYFAWSMWIGLFVIFTLITAGFIFFKNKGALPGSDWMNQWILYCVVIGINQAVSPVLVVLEASGQIRSSYLIRLIQATLAPTIAIVFIFKGYGLWACSIQLFIEITILLIITWKKKSRFFAQVLTKTKDPARGLSWRKEILPMQWRIAISWVSGYLSFYLFVPVAFHYGGPVVAGQLGMTLAVANGISALAASIVSPQVPKMAICIAKKNYPELQNIFLWCQKIISLVGIVWTFTAWLFIELINRYKHPFAERFIGPDDASMLFAATAILVMTLPVSSYLRSFKEDPLFIYSLCMGLLIATLTVIGGKYYSISGELAGYLFVMLLQIPFIYLIWKKRAGNLM